MVQVSLVSRRFGTLTKWYKEGIIDPDFIAQIKRQLMQKLPGGKVAAYVGYSGSMLTYKNSARQQVQSLN